MNTFLIFVVGFSSGFICANLLTKSKPAQRGGYQPIKRAPGPGVPPDRGGSVIGQRGV